MKRADALWLYDSVANILSDNTYALGQGTTPIVLQPNNKLYVGTDDVLSGLLLFINTAPSGTPSIVVETYDAGTDSWVILPTTERIEHEETGYQITAQGYDYTTTGVAQWNAIHTLQQRRLPDVNSGFPEYTSPPTLTPQELYWVRLRNIGTLALQLDRVLPSFYNTYASVESIARFIGMNDFTEITAPMATAVRERIRNQEDILDDYMRWTYRLGMSLSEMDLFDPYGQKTHFAPVIAVTRLGVWTGTNFQTLFQGRNQDYYVDTRLGMIYYTRISLGRGLPWSRAASRYLRQPDSSEYDYVYGGDFDLAPRRGIIREIVHMRVASGLTTMQDWINFFVANPDAVPKSEKVKSWTESSEILAEQIRGLAVI